MQRQGAESGGNRWEMSAGSGWRHWRREEHLDFRHRATVGLTGFTSRLDGGWERTGESGMTPGLSTWKTQLFASTEMSGGCLKTRVEEK